MPVYLLHGFRWPRGGNSGLRTYAILNDLEDCSSEYVQNAHSNAALIESFRKLFPEIMKELDGPGRRLTFLEQYDPEDVTSEHAVSQPFAFVGDKVVTIAGGPKAIAAAGLNRPDTGVSKGSADKRGSAGPGKALSAVAAANGSALSVNVEEVVADGPGFTAQAWEALAELRDKLAENEKIGWWVIYNGDPERAYEDDVETDEEGEGEDILEAGQGTPAKVAIRQKPTAVAISSDEKEIPSPTSTTSTMPKTKRREMPPPTIPVKDTAGKPISSGTATGATRPSPQETSKPRTASKTEGLKKFFTKKGASTN